MELLAISFDVKNVPLEIREQLAFAGDEELARAMQRLKEAPAVLENVILSTCNRTEIYTVVDSLHRGRDYVLRFLSSWFHLPTSEFSPYLQIYSGASAVAEHLFRVTCGLESLIMGEEQILSQVKASLSLAQENRASSTIFNDLFKQAITLSKRAHTETALSQNSVSVGTAAVQLAKQVFGGDLSDKQVLVIGAGQMGALLMKYLSVQKLAGLSLINRTYSKALALTKASVPFESLEEVLATVDIVFTATAAKDFILTESLVKKKSLLIFDLAVPRDVDPALSNLSNIKLYDIGGIRARVEDSLQARSQAAQEVEQMIVAEVAAFEVWLSEQEIVPLISALQAKASLIQQKAMATIDHKLPDLTEHDRKVINKLTKSIANQLLRDPILSAKSLSTEQLQLFKEIFGLE